MEKIIQRVRSAELILLPKSEREYPDVSRWLIDQAGIEVPTFDARQLVANQAGQQFAIVRPTDSLPIVEENPNTVCFAGTDKFKEYQFGRPGWTTKLRTAPIAKPTCRLSIAGLDPNIDLKDGKVRTLGTSFPNTMRAFAKMQDIELYVKSYGGSVEAMPVLGQVDIIADLVSSGESLRKQKLNEIKTIAEIYLGVVWNSGELPPPNEMAIATIDVDAVIEALQTVQQHIRVAKLGKRIAGYTANLVSDPNEVDKKYGSEAMEFLAARLNQNDDAVINEAADLLYAIELELGLRDLTLADALYALAERNITQRLGQ